MGYFCTDYTRLNRKSSASFHNLVPFTTLVEIISICRRFFSTHNSSSISKVKQGISLISTRIYFRRPSWNTVCIIHSLVPSNLTTNRARSSTLTCILIVTLNTPIGSCTSMITVSSNVDTSLNPYTYKQRRHAIKTVHLKTTSTRH